jgi:RHS repeat-associated protein
MGRGAQKSNPTEMNSQWVATGDDLAAGWIYTTQNYDWKSRPTITTNPDNTQRVVSYDGCGCAGGEATTAQDEHGRQRRFTKDVLGRLATVEELTWYGGSVYATTNYTYNVRDQIAQINQAGQVRSFDYDGYGRMQARTTPEQGTTNYSYNNDDTTNVVTDARGATITLGYNGRGLVTSISYGVPGGVAATPNVGIGYDATGNRTSMTDGMGSVSYSYDQLSRLTSETRTFNGVGSFPINYAYNLAGQLTSVTNPWGAQTGYGYDVTGRLTNIGGANYANVSSYASGISYRAFGALKGVTYGNGRALSTSYDNRLRPTSWDVSSVLGYNYAYDYFGEHTGRVTYAQSIYDATLDRSYEYDAVGRLSISHSGAEAQAHAFSGQWGNMNGPYSQGYDYDVWGNITHKFGWGGEVQGGGAGQTSDINYSYTNNRRDGFSYDAAGNLTNDVGQNFAYDAVGQQTSASSAGYSLNQYYDGDGLRVQKTENGSATYYLRSSVLGGQVVAEMDASGNWTRGYVYQGSNLIAVQQGGVYWVHEDPVTKSKRVTDVNGNVVSAIELDPWGADTNRSWNQYFQPKRFNGHDRDANQSDEAMFRRYNRWHSRYDQPDPYDRSYDLTDPQSFNRYAYVGNDPTNFTDPTGLYWAIDYGSCQTVGYITFNFDTRMQQTYEIQVCGTYWVGPFGGGEIGGGGPGGGGPGPQTTQKPKEKKPKCKQDKKGGDRQDIDAQLEKAGLSGLITDERASTVNPEGVVFNISNRQAFLDAIKKNPAFKYDTPWSQDHGPDVGSPRVDNRSVTGAKGLGADTHGVDRSLQVVVGPADPRTGITRGYADLDCDNPAQSVGHAIKHGAPIIFRRIFKP